MYNKIFHPYTPFSALKNELPNIVRGEGIYLLDNAGNRYVDIVSSWWECALGHGHPKVLELADRPVKRMPTPERHCVFASDGCSAVEAALKIAVQYWHNVGRPEKNWLIGMDNHLFVSKYQLELPKPEQMQRFLDEQIKMLGADQ